MLEECIRNAQLTLHRYRRAYCCLLNSLEYGPDKASVQMKSLVLIYILDAHMGQQNCNSDDHFSLTGRNSYKKAACYTMTFLGFFLETSVVIKSL